MKLIDLLEVCDIDLDLLIYDEEGDFIDRYDGKDSIDSIYNDREVISISPANQLKTLEIYIEEE